MDYATLPPEVTSALMYAGPGSGPMIAAAASWDRLANELFSATTHYMSAIASLTGGPWRGTASDSMGAAAAPYVAWMNATATQAARAAGQARAAASAYETAFALTVPPPQIAANRELLAALVASNVLGQNTPAIAATEAHYAKMWAQDAAAMYGYAGSSAAASTLPPFAGPPATTTEAAQARQAAVVGHTTDAATQSGLSRLVSAVPAALQGLASPLSSTTSASSTSGFSALMNWLGLGGANLTTPAGILDFLAGTDGSPLGAFLNNNGLNTIFSSGFYMPGNFLGTMSDFVGMAGADEAAAGEAAPAAAGEAEAAAGEVRGALAGAANGPGGLGSLGGAVSAGLGRGVAIGPLSVPPGWTTVTPAPLAPSSLLGSTPLAAPPAVVAGMPGMPFANAAGNHFNGLNPRYGFRPSVVAHPPAGG
jgi:PPE-repeat protein